MHAWPAIALGADGAMTHPLAPYALAWEANSEVILGRGLEEAYVTAQRALDLAEELDAPHSAPLHTAVGAVDLMTMHLDDAVEQAELAVVHAERDHDDYWMSAACTVLAAALRLSGDLDGAVAAAERALDAARASGNTAAIAQAVNILGYTLVDREPDRALELFDESIELGSALGVPLPLPYALHLSATLYARRDDLVESARRFREALDIALLRGDLRQLGSVLGHVAVVLDDLGAAEPAAITWGAAEGLMPGELLGIGLGSEGEGVRSRKHLEEVLGSRRYTALRDRGASMNPAQAVQYASEQLATVADSDSGEPGESGHDGPG